jgi:hypothetical protein
MPRIPATASDTPSASATSDAMGASATIAERNPEHPIGTPPGGGSWRWDVPSQQWALRDEAPPPSTATDAATETTTG